MFVDECHVTSLNPGLFSTTMEAEKRYPGNEVEEFIDFISTLDDIKGFCSLDVCNLYGSIPLEDLEDGTPGIFTIMKDFFSTHKTATDLQHISDDDFVSLLRLSPVTWS